MIRPFLHYFDIADGVVAFSTTRKGGVSEGNYAAFNINHYCGDSEAAIAVNRQALCRELGIAEERLVYPHQTHQTRVCQIADDFFACSSADRARRLEGVDAVMTDLHGVCVGVSTADCIPIIIYDPNHHAVAAIHAGWRGTVGRIAEKTILRMCEAYGSVPQQLSAVIGPGISLKNFEVGDEVYDAFSSAGFPMEKIAKKLQKWHLDLPFCNQLQLQSAGILATSIQSCDICTYDRVDEYFSARRLGINSGRILTGIMLRP
jgi:YfiH family protein